MKFETAVVIAKLFCVFAGTSLLTLQTGLGQWVHTEKDPTTVQWVMVLGGSLGTGLTATGAFLSNAFGNYLTGRTNGNGNGNGNSNGKPLEIVRVEPEAEKKNAPLTTPPPSATLKT